MWDDLPEPTAEERADPSLYVEHHRALIRARIASGLTMSPMLWHTERTSLPTYGYFMTPPASLPCGCIRSDGRWVKRCVTHQELDNHPQVRAMLDGDC